MKTNKVNNDDNTEYYYCYYYDLPELAKCMII